MRAAELAERLLGKLPGGEYTLRAGLRAVNEYRAISRYVESNLVIQKMFKKGGLPLTRIIRHELYRLQAENFISLSQWANAVASLNLARGQGEGWRPNEGWQLHERQIYSMYQAAMKATQIMPEVKSFSARYPNERTRWINYNHIGNAYAREGDPLRAARAVAPALAHAGADGSMAANYVSWLMDKAVSDRNTANNTNAKSRT